MRVRSSGGSPTVAAHAASDPGARIAPGSLVLGALLVAAVAQVARTLFPAVYLIGEDGSFALAGIAALAIYAAPVLAMALVSLDGRTRLIAGTLLIVVARLAVQFAHPIPPWLAMVATAAVLVGAALAAGADVRRRSALAVTVVLGLALDTALRSPFRSWDLAWQDGAAAVGTTLAAAATAIALLIVARRAPRGGSEEGGAGLRVAALGPYLVLQLLFLQNVGFVGSQGDVGFAAATLVVLVGDALALMALAVAADRPANRAVPAITGTGAALLAFALTLQEGAGSVAVVLALQALGTLCLGWTLEGTARPRGAVVDQRRGRRGRPLVPALSPPLAARHRHAAAVPPGRPAGRRRPRARCRRDQGHQDASFGRFVVSSVPRARRRGRPRRRRARWVAVDGPSGGRDDAAPGR